MILAKMMALLGAPCLLPQMDGWMDGWIGMDTQGRAAEGSHSRCASEDGAHAVASGARL